MLDAIYCTCSIDSTPQLPPSGTPCSFSTSKMNKSQVSPGVALVGVLIAFLIVSQFLFMNGLFDDYLETTTKTIVHRSAVQRLLDDSRAVPLVLNKNNRTRTIDITKNVPRIDDFIGGTTGTWKPVTRRMDLRSYDDWEETELYDKEPNEIPPNTTSDKMNIVLFYADDWTMKVLGALNPHVMTPNIDNMIRHGMLFGSNCVTTSICWVSRATLATGVYAAVHQQTKLNSENLFATLPWNQTLYPLMKQAGYHTGIVGKWHAPSPSPAMKQAFDSRRCYYGHHWEPRDGREQHVTVLNGQDSLVFLEQRPRHKPFFLTTAFFATHAWDGRDVPYQVQPESMEWYVNDTIPRPSTATEQHWKDLPYFFTEENVGRQRYRGRFDEENYDEKIKNLFRMATEVDVQVGRIMQKVKKQGLYDRTLFIFTTDNGNLHGEHGLAEKWYPWEESIQVPLVIQDPRMPSNVLGTRNDDYTLSVDLAPTILQAAGVTPPSFMQGRDIADLYLDTENTAHTWRQDFFYEWNQGDPFTAEGHLGKVCPPVFALIRKDWKYFYWPTFEYEQLFHVEADPTEEWDLLNDTMQTTVDALQVMRARYAFLKNWSQSGNPV